MRMPRSSICFSSVPAGATAGAGKRSGLRHVVVRSGVTATPVRAGRLCPQYRRRVRHRGVQRWVGSRWSPACLHDEWVSESARTVRCRSHGGGAQAHLRDCRSFRLDHVVAGRRALALGRRRLESLEHLQHGIAREADAAQVRRQALVVLPCEQVRHSLLNVSGLTEVRARLEGVPANPGSLMSLSV